MRDRLMEKLFNEAASPIFSSNNLTKYSALKQREDEFKALFNIELVEYVDSKRGFNLSLFIRDFLSEAKLPYKSAVQQKYGERAANLIGELICI
ncbi:hypothetical protein VF14_00840 [Nostoc linckia z18]|uniref:Uncharacterized protein n=2 Tax=Nostoc linckia TaxID=92942 RepID=A0A9Q5ZBX1_NOSLI|nr:hypothetical protein [Nostoc linckia]PHK41368.1 hypothetical protein VF12_06820 [Nostoc linckia z15]PHK45904.1 hypothetical protein VF13_13580 [Nostoc linckia z16]PHJ60856.1 hypothetical protein VF05_29590 [Nostoc linckia z3]PHJ67247.1 hypothetical protein VF02_05635 [Nostoc linckia z1]PHJ76719.1 hypothetical protein VF03_06315 [Nostoc linckia z2]